MICISWLFHYIVSNVIIKCNRVKLSCVKINGTCFIMSFKSICAVLQCNWRDMLTDHLCGRFGPVQHISGHSASLCAIMCNKNSNETLQGSALLLSRYKVGVYNDTPHIVPTLPWSPLAHHKDSKHLKWNYHIFIRVCCCMHIRWLFLSCYCSYCSCSQGFP